jgi:histone deacetylase complex regulatory component SIN3
MDYQTALDFTSTVRNVFANEPWVFDAFLVVLSEYRKQA